MLLSQDLKKLNDTFDGWSVGKPYPTIEDWHAFQRELRHCIAKAALIELGVDCTVFDADAPPLSHGKIVPLFPRGKR